MPEAGFFAQRNNSPGSLGLVILLHGALFGAVVMIKSPVFERITRAPTQVTFLPLDPDPPPVPPPPQAQPRQPRQAQIDQVSQLVTTNTGSTQVSQGQQQTQFAANVGTGEVVLPPPPLPPLVPVRRGAQLDPRHAGDLQPPYPPAELRAERDGRVQARVTIGPDGRVIAITRLSATSDAFWRVTEQQALRRWRFRPATEDGRPVQDSKVMTLVFRITDQG